MFRTFNVYTFVLPNRIEYRQLIRGLIKNHDHEKLLFEVWDLDALSTDGRGFYEYISFEEMLKKNRTLPKLGKLSRFAYAHYETHYRYIQDVNTPYTVSSFNLSNLDDNWQTPNSTGMNDTLPVEELELLLRSISRNRFSAVSFTLDGVSWFGKPLPATYGHTKAISSFNEGIRHNYLSSALTVSVVGYEKRYFLNACFEVTPLSGTDELLCEDEHVARLTDKFGRPKGIKTLYAPSCEADRAMWDNVATLLEQEHKMIRQKNDDQSKDSSGFMGHKHPEVNMLKEAKAVMNSAMKKAGWTKGVDKEYSPFASYYFFKHDAYNNLGELYCFLSHGGSQIQLNMAVSNKTHRYSFILGIGYMDDVTQLSAFFGSALANADANFRSYSDAYEKVLSETGAFSYFHPECCRDV